MKLPSWIFLCQTPSLSLLVVYTQQCDWLPCANNTDFPWRGVVEARGSRHHTQSLPMLPDSRSGAVLNYDRRAALTKYISSPRRTRISLSRCLANCPRPSPHLQRPKAAEHRNGTGHVTSHCVDFI